ncbi:pyridoxal phosphate-dependent decarboxylase family protein [Nonomuraea sp. NPDC059194]|uniref:pyridoxal phosphate-dependent decarboxylase family protein n=1 Tax=Nonomuraea sp. NPDC059194 TaxID=3346764 RepID=UPI0036B96024
MFNPAPTWWGVAGELMAAAVNPQLAAYSHAPAAAVEIERHVLAFLAARLGLPDKTEGTFTTGGAEANLTAVVVALTRAFPSYPTSGLTGRPVLYTSAESHLAWLKIAHMTGLGRDAVRLVPVDAAHRLDTVALHELRAADLAAGRQPFLLVATAGTTAGGALDPDPYATSVQWSRRFAGLKVFLALAIAGLPAYAEQLERDVRLGDLLAVRLRQEGWQRVNDTPLPVICVADPAAEARGPQASAAWHAGVAARVVTGGAAWVSTVRLAGRPAIRLCLTSHRTSPSDIEAVVDALGRARKDESA